MWPYWEQFSFNRAELVPNVCDLILRISSTNGFHLIRNHNAISALYPLGRFSYCGSSLYQLSAVITPQSSQDH